MDVNIFIQNYREAFGENTELPIAFWYLDSPVNQTDKINGCLFKGMKAVREGTPIALNVDLITCGGGKFYTGFTEMPERVPGFVSLKERYKKTPEMVIEYVDELGLSLTEKQYLNFARVDQIDSFEGIEGILFLATPDVLSGLTSWAYFDSNDKDTVTALFASGCCATITQAVIENNRDGKRTFIGFFDPSVRPYFEANILSFMIPMSRFKEMYYTMRESCLFDTHAWKKIRQRITES